MKKLLGGFLSFILVFSLLPSTIVMAKGNDVENGEDVNYTISPSSEAVTITAGGTYYVNGGVYNADSNVAAITIDTLEPVTLCIQGDIEGNYSSFVKSNQAGSLTIKGAYEITSTNDGDAYIIDCIGGTLNVESVVFNTNAYGIHGGNIILRTCDIVAKSKGGVALDGSSITMTDTLIDGFDSSFSSGIVYAKNCAFENLQTAFTVTNQNNITLDGDTVFKNNDKDIVYDSGAFTVQDDFETSSPIKLTLSDSALEKVGDGLQITSSGAYIASAEYFICTNDGYSINYQRGDTFLYGNLYVWKHQHNWVYDGYQTQVLAYCPSENCIFDYNSGGMGMYLFIQTYDNMYNPDGRYYFVKVTNDITAFIGDQASEVFYEGRDGTTYKKSATPPTEAGKYTASIMIGGATASSDFEITKAEQDSPYDLSTSDETIKGKKDGTITGVDSSMEYRKEKEEKYTSVSGNSITGLAGGTYYIRYKELKNYAASCDKKIEIKSGNSLNVNVPEIQSGYTLSVDASSVDYKGSSKITFELDNGYSKTKNFAIKVNGKTITLDKNGEYTIKNITEDQTITVDGVEKIDIPVIDKDQMKENSDGNIEIGKGTILIETKGNISLGTSKIDLIEMLVKDGRITEDELKEVYLGSTLNVSLKATDISGSVSSDSKSLIQEKTKKLGYTLGNQYLDICLYVNDSQVATTSDKIKVSVIVPNNLVNTNQNVKRTYYMIRNHNGEVSCLEGKYDEETKSFTFETNQFSTYVLAYKDTTVKQSETKKAESKQSTKKSTNTSVQSNMGLYISLVIVSMIGLVVLIRRRYEMKAER